MATTASIEASEIRRRGRRRLIGAIVLVVLAVVFIPMILDSEPRPQRDDASLEIPAKDKVTPLPAPAPAKPVEAAPAPVTPEKAVTPEKTVAVTPPKAVTPEKTVAVTPPKAVTPAKAGAQDTAAGVQRAEPTLEGFAVQVGAFRDEQKLTQAREKLMAAKIPHFVERRGDLNRLRAGPYSTREAAEKALASIKAASLDGQVVPLP